MGVAEVFRVINTDARFSSLLARRHLLPETFSHTVPDSVVRGSMIPEENLLILPPSTVPPLLIRALPFLFSGSVGGVTPRSQR